MGKFMKILYSIMLIILLLLGALFLVLGIDINSLPLTIMEVTFLRDLLSNVAFIKGLFLSLGVLLIAFSIIILVTLKKNSNRGFDVLIEDEKGSILLTRKSLEVIMEKAIGKFFEVKTIKTKAVIVENEKIEAKALVDYFGSDDVNLLSQRMRDEIIERLKEFTGLTDVRLDLKIDKKEIEKR